MTVVFLILVAFALFFGFLAAKPDVRATTEEVSEVEESFECELAAAS
ncbi:MAG: hypothetical protein ACN4GK_09805 [Acidimicrobiia bacterium]